MFGASAGSTLSRWRHLRPSLGCALLLAGLPQVAAAWVPIVELKFDEASGTTSSNTGSVGGSATLSATTPSRSSNTPINGGANALDFGSAEGHFYADLLAANALNAVKNLKSFTIAGWVNCRSSQTNYGGGRIVSWMKNGAGFGGVDLAFRSDGSLGLGVDTWNDDEVLGVTSNPGKIPVDAGTSYNNWRFIAVSYDGTASTNNVKFYFGTNNVPASLDKTVSLDQGTTAGTIAGSVTVGNIAVSLRTSGPFTSVFRGLIDQVRIYGSTSNNSGVLTLDQIQSLQQAAPLVNVPGVVYEQWNNIAGNSVSALLSDPRYPYSPSITKLQPSFEGFTNVGDNFGARLSGWVKAPATGTYTFWIVSDDNGELRLSTDANPDNKRLIASVGSYNSTQESWEQFGSQRSEPVTLQANQYYYLEVLVKDGGGGDFVRVGWQLPSGTLERPIPQARLVTTPPDGVPFYPSVYPLYEPGTFVKKAEMGWQKEDGNDHFYIKTDETKALMAKNGTIIIPERLFFGGQYPSYPIDVTKGDLGFKYERGVESAIGTLTLENQAGQWAMRVFSFGGTEEPQVQFNQSTSLLGPPYQEYPGASTWSGYSSTHNVLGTFFDRSRHESEPGNYYVERSNHNGAGLTVTRSSDQWGFIEAESTWVSGGRVAVKGQDIYSPTITGSAEMTRYGIRYEVVVGDSVASLTSIDGSGLTTNKDVNAQNVYASRVDTDTLHANDIVTTPKWRIIPDYVFEKGYKLRSLAETERFVREKKHLPEIPSAKEMSTRGMSLTDMNLKLLKKVEELTLHMIAMDKEMKAQQDKSGRLEQEVRALRGAGKGN